MSSVFISHSWKDKSIARRIGNSLNAVGVKVWIDEARIKIGDSLIEKIRRGIDEMDFLIALISKNSINSEWVTKELDIAMNQEIRKKHVKVLPVLLDDSHLPGFLEGKLYADVPRIGFKAMISMVLDKCNISFDQSKSVFTKKKLSFSQIFEILSNGTHDKIRELMESIRKKDKELLSNQHFYNQLEMALYRVNSEELFSLTFSVINSNREFTDSAVTYRDVFLTNFLDIHTSPTLLLSVLSNLGKPNRFVNKSLNMNIATLYKILDILKQHISPELDTTCLDFFIYQHSKLDEILSMELETLYLNSCMLCHPQFLEAKWMEVIINIYVSCPYCNLDSIDIVFNVWEKCLKEGNKYIVRSIVDALKRHHMDEDLSLFEHRRDKRIYKLIQMTLDYGDNLLICDLLQVIINTHNFDTITWVKLASFDPNYFINFFEFTLDEYYVNYIFSDDDVEGMLNLCKVHEALQAPISDVLSRLHTRKAITALAEINLPFSQKSSSWENRDANILLTGLKHKYFENIVVQSYDNIKLSSTDDFENLLIAIYDFYKGKISEEQFCSILPKSSGCEFSRPRRNIIIEILNQIKKSADKNNKIRIDVAIKKYEEEGKSLED